MNSSMRGNLMGLLALASMGESYMHSDSNHVKVVPDTDEQI